MAHDIPLVIETHALKRLLSSGETIRRSCNVISGNGYKLVIPIETLRILFSESGQISKLRLSLAQLIEEATDGSVAFSVSARTLLKKEMKRPQKSNGVHSLPHVATKKQMLHVLAHENLLTQTLHRIYEGESKSTQKQSLKDLDVVFRKAAQKVSSSTLITKMLAVDNHLKFRHVKPLLPVLSFLPKISRRTVRMALYSKRYPILRSTLIMLFVRTLGKAVNPNDLPEELGFVKSMGAYTWQSLGPMITASTLPYLVADDLAFIRFTDFLHAKHVTECESFALDKLIGVESSSTPVGTSIQVDSTV